MNTVAASVQWKITKQNLNTHDRLLIKTDVVKTILLELPQAFTYNTAIIQIPRISRSVSS